MTPPKRKPPTEAAAVAAEAGLPEAEVAEELAAPSAEDAPEPDPTPEEPATEADPVDREEHPEPNPVVHLMGGPTGLLDACGEAPSGRQLVVAPSSAADRITCRECQVLAAEELAAEEGEQPEAPSEPEREPLPVIRLLGEVMAGVQPIAKSQENREQGYSFRGIDQVMRELHPLLSARGVLILPTVLERIPETRTTRSGSAMYAVHLHVAYRFVGPLGDELVVDAWGEGADTADKSTSKAMTAALKAALLQTFLVPTPDTVDADATTPEPTYSAGQVERAEAAATATRECTELLKLAAIGSHAYQQGLLDCPVREVVNGGTEPLRALLDRTRAKLQQDYDAERTQAKPPAEAPAPDAAPAAPGEEQRVEPPAGAEQLDGGTDGDPGVTERTAEEAEQWARGMAAVTAYLRGHGWTPDRAYPCGCNPNRLCVDHARERDQESQHVAWQETRAAAEPIQGELVGPEDGPADRG